MVKKHLSLAILSALLGLSACGGSGNNDTTTHLDTDTDTTIDQSQPGDGGETAGDADSPNNPALDSDNDGISDSLDKCENTLSNIEVNELGCDTNVESIIIEAEDYVLFFDDSEGNEGEAYREDDVDVEATEDGDGGYNVGWTNAGEWLEYNVELSQSNYILSTRVASDQNGAEYAIYLDGDLIATDTIEATGGWQTFETHDLDLVTTKQGSQTLRIEFTQGPVNLNWISFKTDDGSFVEPVVLPPEPEQPALDLPVVEAVIEENPISPTTAINEMGIGINLGNTLDAPTEGAWAPAAQEQFLIDFKDAGFKHVRIPVTWDKRTDTKAPYQIDAEQLDRVEQVVDWAIAQDYYVILNAHHEGWLKNNFSSQNTRNRFDSIWMQVAERFKNKSAKLMLEILNEPNGMTVAEVDELNIRILSIIRNVMPKRLVVFSGNGYTPIDALEAAAIPDANDEYLIANYHSYDPWPFAGQCLESWGTEEDKSALESIYQRAQTWVTENNIPVMVNEFGVAHYDFTAPENVCDENERLAYIAAHVEFAKKYNIAITFWDDAGSFSTYDRAKNTWGSEKDILINP